MIVLQQTQATNKKWIIATIGYLGHLVLLALAFHEPWLISDGFLSDYYVWDTNKLLIPTVAFAVISLGTGGAVIFGGMKKKTVGIIHIITGAAVILYAMYVWTEVNPHVNLFDLTTLFMQFTAPAAGLYSYGASGLFLLLGGICLGDQN